MFFNGFGVLWALRGPLGGQSASRPSQNHPTPKSISPFWCDFGVILETWGHNKSQWFVDIFLKGPWGDFGPTWKAKGIQKDVNGGHFGWLWGDKWKSENYAPVRAGASLLRSEGASGDIIGTTLGTLSFRCLSELFFQYVIGFGVTLSAPQDECACAVESHIAVSACMFAKQILKSSNRLGCCRFLRK